jgi:AraC-like DNA-binding protein/ligand-binding sensor protein
MPVNNPTFVPAVSAAEADRLVIQHLQRSALFQDYAKAFEEATGLPLVLRVAGSFLFPLHDSSRSNPFCTVMSGTNKSCSACLQFQQQVETESTSVAKTLECHAGRYETAVPIHTGARVLGYLQTGQVFQLAPTQAHYLRVRRKLAELGPVVDHPGFKAAWLQSRVVPEQQYNCVVKLLEIFAQHLSTLSSEALLHSATSESPMVVRARVYIAEHQTEILTLHEVAQAMHTSVFYFCKIFKQTTGLTFTNYLAHLRVKAVKEMLVNPRMRVSEAAYASGFQSLSQFNRVFRRITGETPKIYRVRNPFITSASPMLIPLLA